MSTSTSSSSPDGPTSFNVTLETCAGKFEDFNFPTDSLFCNWTYDSYLCWPPTRANSVAYQKCPIAKGLDPSKLAERRCNSEGRWAGKPGTPQISNQGWTNFTPCYLPDVLELLMKMGNQKEAIIRQGSHGIDVNSRHGIDNTPYLCEGSYVLMEYARTAMFLWMFIEGLYLHNVVTVTVFQGKFPHLIYAAIGWGSPVLMTAVWAGFTATSKHNQNCWYGYNLTPYYWILEGPRLTVILLNFIFLLNIIRVLVVKLRQSHTSDIEQVRKAVRAAVVLLPLLGITNLLNMTEAPLDRSALVFAMWSYITHFLTSFQGFFIAMIYCFLNGEVRTAILKWISVYMSLRGHHDWAVRRTSMFSRNYATEAEIEQQLPSHNNVNDNTKRNCQSSRKSQRSWINLLFFPKQITRLPAEQPESVVFDISD